MGLLSALGLVISPTSCEGFSGDGDRDLGDFMKIVLFVVLILFIVVVFAAPKEQLSLKNKITILLFGLVIFLAGFFYNIKVDNDTLKTAEIITDFRAGKTIKCGDLDIDKSGWEYEFGTASFVAKNEDMGGLIISVKRCFDGRD